ncbi:MAG: hypothetical protein J6C33_11350 [Lachnospiraceae bacterium]|nr:hypothetical protein [Lachnospiraceae bacterium]
MNKRQSKKQFKKRFGFNPPRNISIHRATQIMKNRENIIAAFERMKKAILDLWEQVKKSALELVEALKNFQTKVLLQQRQQESEVMRIESNINISNHDRR